MPKSVKGIEAEAGIISTHFPVYQAIFLPRNDNTINVLDENVEGNVHSLTKYEKDNNVKPAAAPDPSPQYANVNFHEDNSEQPSLSKTEPTPHSPTSIYTLGGSMTKPRLELKDRELSSRQCKFEIGEEWEQYQFIHTKSISCPPTPVADGRHGEVIDGHDNLSYVASEPGVEIEQDLTGVSETSKETFPFHFLFSTSSTNAVKEHQIVPNPYNKINQRFHSALQCPCFLFFCFLCCLPAVLFMQQSELQFRKGNMLQSRNNGRCSTMLYTVGLLLGVVFLSVTIYFVADYIKQFV